MNEILTVFLTACFLATLIYIIICLAEVTTFDGPNNSGTFYAFFKSQIETIKNSKLFGKILFLPILLYTLLCETIAIIVAMTFLFCKSLCIYFFNKEIKYKDAFKMSFNCHKHIVLDFNDKKYIAYKFMGYTWKKPYVNTDIIH